MSKQSWFTTQPTVRRIVWVAVGLVVVYSTVEMFGQGFTRAVIGGLAKKFGIEIEAP